MPKFATTVTVPFWALGETNLRDLISTIKAVEHELHLDEPDTIPNSVSITCLRLCTEELAMRSPEGHKQPLNGYFRNGSWVQPYRQF